jgi:hypothetical protein
MATLATKRGTHRVHAARRALVRGNVLRTQSALDYGVG